MKRIVPVVQAQFVADAQYGDKVDNSENRDSDGRPISIARHVQGSTCHPFSRSRSVEQFAVHGRIQEPGQSVAVSRISRNLAKISSVETDTNGQTTLLRKQLNQYFAQLQNQFGPVSRKIGALSKLACLERPGFHQLARLAEETVRLSRLIERQLGHGADVRALNVPDPIWIDELIEQCSDYQDRLQRQLALATQLREKASLLRDELNVLAMRGRDRTGSLAFDGLRGLAKRIVSELMYDVSPPLIHPKLALEVLTDLLGDQAEAKICVIAFASAQAVARVARVTWLRADQVELVTSAALLQDCGQLLTLDSAELVKPARKSRRGDHHPLVGAAIIGGYRNAPTGLAQLIAEHHERISGYGYPARLASDQQNGFSRLLAAASRLERLRLRVAIDSDLLTLPDLAEGPALQQFWAEVQAGDWDPEMSRKLLIQRDVPQDLQGCFE